MDLFNPNPPKPFSYDPHAPLAARMRPRNLEEYFGQAHLLGEGKLLKRTILSDRLASLILYGPPGTGKTTLASIISKMTGARFKIINAVTSNVEDMRRVIEEDDRRFRKKLKSSIGVGNDRDN